MNYKKLLTTLVALSSLSFATIYEDAEDGATNRWIIYDNNPLGATINNINDISKNSKVIEFKGKGRRNSYMIGYKHGKRAWNNGKERTLKWAMNFNEKFKISIYLQTKKGKRVLIYDYKKHDKGLYKKRYIRIGLGSDSMSGKWINFERNLEKDLNTYEADNSILLVNGFKVQGSGMVDDIELVNDAPVSEVFLGANDFLALTDTTTLANGDTIQVTSPELNDGTCKVVVTNTTTNTVLGEFNNCIDEHQGDETTYQRTTGDIRISSDGNKAYIIKNMINGGFIDDTFLLIYDISNPSAPNKISETDLHMKLSIPIHFIDSTHLLVKGWNGDNDANPGDRDPYFSRIIDVSNATTPNVGEKHRSTQHQRDIMGQGFTVQTDKITLIYDNGNDNALVTLQSSAEKALFSDDKHSIYVPLENGGIEVIDYDNGNSSDLLTPHINPTEMSFITPMEGIIFNETQIEYFNFDNI